MLIGDALQHCLETRAKLFESLGSLLIDAITLKCLIGLHWSSLVLTGPHWVSLALTVPHISDQNVRLNFGALKCTQFIAPLSQRGNFGNPFNGTCENVCFQFSVRSAECSQLVHTVLVVIINYLCVLSIFGALNLSLAGNFRNSTAKCLSFKPPTPLKSLLKSNTAWL